jgi:hypothetical protein
MAKQKDKLIEGRKYPFTVLKTTVMPGDDQEYIVLEDPYQKRHLLPAILYRNHNLNPGRKILCRIDKINCNGKIYLEPEHPCYEEGRRYDFEFIRYEKRINQIGETEDVALVKDVFGNTLTTPVTEINREMKQEMTINCKVEIIKRGKIHLSVIRRGRFVKHLKAGKSYEFKVKQLARGVDNHDYFVLEDSNGQHHLLREEYFSDYQITVGGIVHGTVVKFDSDGRFLIEPDHPYYRLGMKYPFEAVKKVEERNAQNDYLSFLIVKDHRELLYKVALNHKPEKLTNLPRTVKCVIEKVRKGKLILSLDESSL